MTIKEVKEYYKGQYVECEIYRFTDFTHRVHSDFIYTSDDIEHDQYNENEEVVYEELMDEKEYGMTVIANTDTAADFEDWFGDKNAQILVIILSENLPRYWVTYAGTKELIDSFDTYENASKALKKHEEQDKADGIYTEDFYEILFK